MNEAPDIAAIIPALTALTNALHERQRQVMRNASHVPEAARRLQGTTLAVLVAVGEDGIQQHQLARRLALSPSDADYSVGALRDAGLLTEQRSRGDRRKIDLRLTAAGAAAVEAHHAGLRPPITDTGEGSGPRIEIDVAAAIAVLDALAAEIAEQTKDAAAGGGKG